MGQYYTPIIKNIEGKVKTFDSRQYNNGLKLMEHSYMGNNFVAAVLNELEIPHQVWWLGDYAIFGDFKNKEFALYSKERKRYQCSKTLRVQPTFENQEWVYNNFFLVNLIKREYIQLASYDSQSWQICPFPLLTSVGNGKGGGDYYGINQDKVGIWAGDTILVSKTCKYPDFINKTLEYYFEECQKEEI